MAVEKGFSTAESILRAYIENAPNGRPRLYSARTNLQDDCIRHVHITDGEFCACLEVSDNKPFTLDYPPNVYIAPKISLSVRRSRLHEIEENVKVFDIIGGFYFVQDNGRVYQVRGRNKDRVKENVFKLYKGKTLRKDLLTDVSNFYRNFIAMKIGKIRPDLAVVI
jgi:hypothetical protein